MTEEALFADAEVAEVATFAVGAEAEEAAEVAADEEIFAAGEAVLGAATAEFTGVPEGRADLTEAGEAAVFAADAEDAEEAAAFTEEFTAGVPAEFASPPLPAALEKYPNAPLPSFKACLFTCPEEFTVLPFLTCSKAP